MNAPKVPKAHWHGDEIRQRHVHPVPTGREVVAGLVHTQDSQERGGVRHAHHEPAPDSERLQHPLQEAHNRSGAAHMFEEDQSALSAEYAPRLAERATIIWNGAQGERAHGGIERPARERQVLCVGNMEVHTPSKFLRSGRGDFDHCRAHIHRRHIHLRPIVREVPACASRNLEHVSRRL